MFPPRLMLSGSLRQTLRYGENPHQAAAFYAIGARSGVATAEQVQGKALSYNNLNDTDAAFECVAEFDAPTVAIIKHATPCGVASAACLADAWDAAFRCDPVSPYGGIVAVNRTLDAAAAEKIAAIFTEVIIAPHADEGARAVLGRKKNLRVLLTGGMPGAASGGLTFRSVSGGFLAQSRDTGRIGASDVKVVTQRAPTEAEMADLLFAFRVCKHVKSNAIVYARNEASVGIGGGQPNRVDSARIAAWKSEVAAKAAGLGERLTQGSVVASDAFFPFADGLRLRSRLERRQSYSRRINPGRGGRGGGGCGRAGDGVHWDAALPALGCCRCRCRVDTVRQYEQEPAMAEPMSTKKASVLVAITCKVDVTMLQDGFR